MADRKKIELKFRTEGESKAYMEGYSSAVNTFCWWLKNHPVDEAINSMILVADTLTHTFVMKDNTKERPHGEWKEFTVSTYRGTDEWGEPKWGKGKKFICKRCGRRTVIRENFCPNCGADMREGEAE